jgi:hypothetical protein
MSLNPLKKRKNSADVKKKIKKKSRFSPFFPVTLPKLCKRFAWKNKLSSSEALAKLGGNKSTLVLPG